MKDPEIENILDIIDYGVEWVDSCEDNSSYKAGSFETIGYVIASLLCSRIGLKECATSDVVVSLELHHFLPRSKRKNLLLEFIKN